MELRKHIHERRRGTQQQRLVPSALLNILFKTLTEPMRGQGGAVAMQFPPTQGTGAIRVVTQLFQLISMNRSNK